jgi:hypothetical protein
VIFVPTKQWGFLEHSSKVQLRRYGARSIESNATGPKKSIKLPCSWVFIGTARSLGVKGVRCGIAR